MKLSDGRKRKNSMPKDAAPLPNERRTNVGLALARRRPLGHCRRSINERTHLAQTNLTAPVESAGIASFLKRETCAFHAQLDSKLQLLRPPITRTRFVHMIKRLYGFHAVWEQGLQRHAHLNEFMKGRSRLSCLEADLAALRVPHGEFSEIERCWASAELVCDEAAALGSCYVVEGSTLGGQIITKALSSETWAPPGGLRTFNPYEAETASMWRSFTLWLEANAHHADRASILRGARGTFALLASWLPA